MTSAYFQIGVEQEMSHASRSPTTYQVTKRVIDLTVTAVLLVLLALPLLLVALLIKLDSPGPVIFAQERAGGRGGRRRGLNGTEPRVFRIYKFRSMFHGADEKAHEDHIRKYVAGELKARTSSGRATFKLVEDDRVTRVGRFVRRTSLDELPQLFNVLRGDMSLVGPRPVPLYEVAHYAGDDLQRFAVLGGLSGLWQVKGRSDVSFEEMIKLDIEYVGRRSTWLDLKIMILTIPTLLTRRGAA